MAKKGLGKGLDALFQTYDNLESLEEEGRDLDSKVLELRLNDIDPNEEQPRRDFNLDSINELSRSIQEHGVVQPIIVKPQGGRYTIIAGERRWRAARLAGLERIPVIIRQMDDKEMLEIALIENLQREDLNPMEEAEGISSLIESYGLTQEQVAQRLGKSRPAISNSLRLLNLPKEVRKLLIEDKITTGHARALLTLDSDKKKVEVANLIVEKGLSVREVETLVKRIKEGNKGDNKKQEKDRPSFIIELEGRMEESLGTKVTIQQGKRKGLIGIEYYNNDDLERIIEIISG